MSDSSTRTHESPVDRLRQEFEKLIDNVWTQGEKAADAMGLKTRLWSPAADVIETPDGVQVLIDIPGLDPSEIQILLTGNMLTIKGERRSQEASKPDVLHRRERFVGTFQRAIPLPISVDAEQVQATAKNGVLAVTLKRSAPPTAREIRVETASASDVTPQM